MGIGNDPRVFRQALGLGSEIGDWSAGRKASDFASELDGLDVDSVSV